jgi:hypothetical protein
MTARASLRRALRPPRSSSLGTPEPDGARILNYSDPELIAELIEAHLAGEPLVTRTGRRSVVEHVSVDDY